MSTTRKTPKLRFPEFTDDWEQRKLSDYLFTSKEKNVNNKYGRKDVYSVSGEFGVVNQIEFQGRSFAGKTLDGYDVIHKGEVVYTKSPLKSNPYGIIKTNKRETGIVSTLYAVYKPKDTCFANFVEDYFNSDSRTNRYLSPLISKGAKNTINVSDDKALDGIVIFPSTEEQRKISTYFEKLNNLITLHQRKPKLLSSNLNFFFVSEYAHPWEQRKLSDISERVTRKNKNLEYSLPLTISAQYGLVDQHEFFNKRIAAKDVSGYYVIKNGEFAYNKSYSEGYPWGAVKRLDRYENGVLSTLYILFSVKNVDSDFLVSYYDTNNWHSEVQQRSAEGARNHGLLNISASDFFDTELVIPQDPNEQKKIGLLFKKLDSTITLHQR